jgi:hypothetical protein
MAEKRVCCKTWRGGKNTLKTGLVVMVILKWILMNSEEIAWNGFFQLRISTWGGLF